MPGREAEELETTFDHCSLFESVPEDGFVCCQYRPIVRGSARDPLYIAGILSEKIIVKENLEAEVKQMLLDPDPEISVNEQRHATFSRDEDSYSMADSISFRSHR